MLSERLEQVPRSLIHNTMDKLSWLTAFFVAALACVAIYLCFVSCGDDERRNSSRSTPLPTSRTQLLHPSTQPDSYSRGQTNGRPPAAYNHFYHSSRGPTHTTRDAGRAPSTPSYAKPSYSQPPSSTSFIQPVAKTQESPASRNNDHHASRACATSSYVWQPHAAPMPAPTHASPPAPLPSIRVDQNKTGTTTAAGYGNSFHRTDLASHYVGKSGQIPSTSNRAQASYHQFPTCPHVTEATVKTKAGPTSTDHEGHRLRPSLAYASESRAAFETSACTDVSRPPPPLTSLHLNTTTTADTTYDVHRPRLAPPYSEETPLTVPVAPCISTQPYTHISSSGRLDTSSSSRVVPRSPSPVTDTQYDVKVEAVANAQEMKAARELRERARRCKREMHVARDLAKSTRKSGDHQAEQRHKHDAMASESQMKDLDKRAAKIIFRENNKVRGHPSRYQSHAQPPSCQAQKEGTVDLHGLYVPEALEYAKKELQSATYRNDDKLCFIVGMSFSEPCIICT